jgi:hypothetical protein
MTIIGLIVVVPVTVWALYSNTFGLAAAAGTTAVVAVVGGITLELQATRKALVADGGERRD